MGGAAGARFPRGAMTALSGDAGDVAPPALLELLVLESLARERRGALRMGRGQSGNPTGKPA